MDVSQFYATVSAVMIANGLCLFVLYSGRKLDEYRALKQPVPWRFILGGLIPLAIGAAGATLIVS